MTVTRRSSTVIPPSAPIGAISRTSWPQKARIVPSRSSNQARGLGTRRGSKNAATGRGLLVAVLYSRPNKGVFSIVDSTIEIPPLLPRSPRDKALNRFSIHLAESTVGHIFGHAFDISLGLSRAIPSYSISTEALGSIQGMTSF